MLTSDNLAHLPLYENSSEDVQKETIRQLIKLSTDIKISEGLNDLTLSLIEVSFVSITDMYKFWQSVGRVSNGKSSLEIEVIHPAYPETTFTLTSHDSSLYQLLMDCFQGKKLNIAEKIKIVVKYLIYYHPINKNKVAICLMEKYKEL